MTQTDALVKAALQVMPFGKYQGRFLIDVPEHYLCWMERKGWPNSQLGQQLALIYEIKLNGLEKMVKKAVEPYMDNGDVKLDVSQ